MLKTSQINNHQKLQEVRNQIYHIFHVDLLNKTIHHLKNKIKYKLENLRKLYLENPISLQRKCLLGIMTSKINLQITNHRKLQEVRNQISLIFHVNLVKKGVYHYKNKMK